MLIDDPEVIARYTESDCWILAWAIHARTGWQIHTVHPRFTNHDQWGHVVVAIPDHPGWFVDIEGVHERDDIKSRWNADAVVPLPLDITVEQYLDTLTIARYCVEYMDDPMTMACASRVLTRLRFTLAVV